MFALYTFTFMGLLTYVLNRAYVYFNPYKTFEDKYINDEYKLLCYRIFFEDGSETVESELTDEQVEKIEADASLKIKYIVIEYMYNGEFMKYITYIKDIRFPIYPFDISPTKYAYYPEFIILNEMDITKYIRPWLGPYCNFYTDREEPIKLEDALMDHPEYENIAEWLAGNAEKPKIDGLTDVALERAFVFFQNNFWHFLFYQYF